MPGPEGPSCAQLGQIHSCSFRHSFPSIHSEGGPGNAQKCVSILEIFFCLGDSCFFFESQPLTQHCCAHHHQSRFPEQFGSNQPKLMGKTGRDAPLPHPGQENPWISWLLSCLVPLVQEHLAVRWLLQLCHHVQGEL